MSARRWNVSGVVVGSKFLGHVTAETAEEALREGLDLAFVSLCHQCSDECADAEIESITVSCGGEEATDREESWQAKARAAGWTPPATPSPTLRPEDAIVSLDLTGRSKCLLIRAGITQIRDLTARTAGDILMLRGFGPACLREVKEALAAHGLRLAGGAS